MKQKNELEAKNESTPQLSHKLLVFQQEMESIKKDATNPHFKSRYATLPHILSEVKPLINAQKLILLQPIKDNRVYSIILDVESGDSMESYIDLPSNLDPQKLGSAITYFRRYTLASLLALEVEDDDGNNAVKPTSSNSYSDKDDDKRWLNPETSDWAYVVSRMRSGVKFEKVLETFKISKSNKEALLKEVNG